MEELINSLKLSQILRISCSDIAGITGYHPYQNPLDLLEKYLYQDLELLQEYDAKKLSIEILSTQQEIDILLNKLNETERQQLQAIESKIQIQSNINNHLKAQEF